MAFLFSQRLSTSLSRELWHASETGVRPNVELEQNSRNNHISRLLFASSSQRYDPREREYDMDWNGIT